MVLLTLGVERLRVQQPPGRCPVLYPMLPQFRVGLGQELIGWKRKEGRIDGMDGWRRMDGWNGERRKGKWRREGEGRTDRWMDGEALPGQEVDAQALTALSQESQDV